MNYGKAVTKLAEAWHKRPDLYTTEQADALKRSYLENREAAYQTIANAYINAGLEPPNRTIMSGE